VIGEMALLVHLAVDLPERGPRREPAGEGTVDGSDAADRELGERLAEHGAAFTVDADDLDAREAFPACDRRRGHVRRLGGDGEFLILLPGTGFRQPVREPGAILPGAAVPARGLRVPAG